MARPGSRHRARWQDVEDLLAAGIDVISAARVAPKPQLLEWVTTMNAAVQAMENMQYARRRWLILATVAIAQLMIILDLTIVNVALPSAKRSLHFATVDRQWVVTAYALAFGSLLLLGGRLADLLGRKVTFMAGLAGFAVASAVGGASVNFAMLVTARACQGAFAAVMAPSALSILTNTFAEQRDRGKAFAVFGAIAGAGASVGLLLGGVLTEYLSWRWTLYANLLFAGAALAGAAALLTGGADPRRPAAGLAGRRAGRRGDVLPGLRVRQRRHAQLARAIDLGLPPMPSPGWPSSPAGQVRVPRTRCCCPRDGAESSTGASRFWHAVRQRRRFLFGILLVPHLLPADHTAVLAAGHRPGVPALPGRGGGVGQCRADRADAADRPQAAGRARPADRGRRHGVADPDRRPFRVRVGRPRAAAGDRARHRAGDRPCGEHRHVRRRAVRRRGGRGDHQRLAQRAGGSIRTSLLNTMVASATAGYLASHLNPGTTLAGRPSAALVQQSLVHGYTVGFGWTAGIFAAGAVVCGTLLRRGPLRPRQEPAATASLCSSTH